MKIEIYQEQRGSTQIRNGWRWRLKARNGRIMADSGEAYSTKAGCTNALRKIFGRPTSMIMHRAMLDAETVPE